MSTVNEKNQSLELMKEVEDLEELMKEVKLKMEELNVRSKNEDPEGPHVDADSLVVSVLWQIANAPGSSFAANKENLHRLKQTLDLYKSMRKFYA